MQEKEFNVGNERYRIKDFRNEFEDGDKGNGLITCSYQVEINGEFSKIKFKLPYTPDDPEAFEAAFQAEIDKQVAKHNQAN